MNLWDHWKKGFETWEGRTAEVLESALKSSIVLRPAGSLLTVTMKIKGKVDRVLAGGWSSLGLPTRREQERTLHSLNQLHSKLADLEEKLNDLQSSRRG